MGMFDSYGSKEHQLKVNYPECRCREFKIGDSVPIHDGVYLCNTGVVVVVDGKLVYESDVVFDKYDHDFEAGKIHALIHDEVKYEQLCKRK